MADEIKDVKGYEDFYTISSAGVVFSKRYNKPLKHGIDKRDGARNVKLCNDIGIVKTYTVIKLMALAFLENPNPKLYNRAINKNGVNSDLRIENIMWGTSSMSANRKLVRRPDLLESFKKTANKINTRKMTDKLVNDLYKMKDLGYSIKQLSDIFPIKKSQIFNLLKKRSNDNPKKSTI